MNMLEYCENYLAKTEKSLFLKKKKELGIMILDKDFSLTKSGKKFFKNTYLRLNNLLLNNAGFTDLMVSALEKPCTDDISNIASSFLNNVMKTVFWSISSSDFIFGENDGLPMNFLKSLPDIKNIVDKISLKEEISFKKEIRFNEYLNELFGASFTFKVYSQIEDLIRFALYSKMIKDPKMLDKSDFITKKFSFGEIGEFNLLFNVFYIIATNISLSVSDENNDSIMLLEINKYLEKENNVITKDNKELRQQLEMNQSETEKLLNKIKSLEEKTNELQKKNDELQKTIYKKDKELSHKECQSSSTKNIKTGNVASDKMFKEEIIEITNKKIEIENIDTTKKLLFVGGYIPTIRKLKTVYKNSENIMNCSAICSANYIKSFDGIVFFTNFISHSLYEKIKNVAKSNNCKWIHCHSDNIDLIVKEINKSFVEKTSQAV